jgi:YesN/AraC family two-component response regulator
MITDVVMPQMGGAKLAGELAFERPDMKVLFVSGYRRKHGSTPRRD